MARWDFREKEKMELESENKRRAGVRMNKLPGYSYYCLNNFFFQLIMAQNMYKYRSISSFAFLFLDRTKCAAH